MERCKFPIRKHGRAGAAAIALVMLPAIASAQLTVSEDFTGTTLSNPWTAINGACLTAGASSNGSIPGCVGLRYYITNGDAYQVGGQSGFLGGTTAPSSNASEIPDPIINGVGYGALRLTNGLPNYHESGAIVSTSPFPASSGVQITFKTISYQGNSGGSGGDGADGISFFLLDASQYVPGSGLLGSWGGSLGYSCSNQNTPYTGQVGAYVGLGMDEYGNFLNGGPNSSGGYNDNTATGVAHVGWGSGNYQWNRIGLRGAGNVAWSWLNTNYPADYPSTLTVAQQATAVQTTCETGQIWNYSTPSSPVSTGVAVLDYAPIPNGSAVLPKGLSIANEAATTRAQATPIYYVLKIDSTGLLSLSYSYGGGSLTQVLTNQSITASNGSLPTQLLFGFAGSTGGSDNVHEILCFQAEPADQSDASTTVNLPLDKLITNAQVFVPSYHTNNWWGQLTAQSLSQTSTYTLAVGQVNWDASCVLTGGPCQSMNNQTVTGTPETPPSRTILSWNGTNGVAFEWGSLSAAEQNVLDPSAVGSPTSTRLNYLRGDRTDEVPPTGAAGAQIYRDRTGVLGDIIHGSPFWVGPPARTNYEIIFGDNLYPGSIPAENAGSAVSYLTYYNTFAGRENIVYVGANDGLLHGFRSGYFANGSLVTTSNDGLEVLAYMPAAIVESIHSASAAYDYSSPNYSHIFGVDAPPHADDLFYAGSWHTWLFGGLGAGGSAIYALDVTDPTQFNEGKAANLVMGEWSAANIVCSNVANCAGHLGDTYGRPAVGRFHATNAQGNNMWGLVFGNGFPETIAASISPTFTGSIGNRFDAVIGDFFTGTIAGRVLTVTAGTPPAINATISGLNVTAGTTITSQNTVPCPPFPCTYGLNHRSTVATPEQMTVATTNMYVSSGSGLAPNQTLLDVPVPGTTIVSQTSGVPGGPGVYVVSAAQLLASSTILGTGNVLIVSANGVGLTVGQTITGVGVAAGTTIVNQIDGDPGSIGHYTVGVAQAVASEQMSNGLTALTIVGGNGLAVGQTVAGAGVTAGTKITSMGSGDGGPGIYAVNNSQTVALEQMTASSGGGTAGIFVMLVDPGSGAESFYYLDTGYGPNNDPLGQARYNGISFVAPADLDGDNNVDYVYAGDLFGNVWRFDLTSNNPMNWAVSQYGHGVGTPLFSSPATMSAGVLVDQPITTMPVASVTGQATGNLAVIVNFGTGQETPLTPISPTTYAPGPQALYGVWDWDMSNWNSLSHMSLASASEATVGTLLGGPITPANLTVQTLTETGAQVATDTSNTVCWYGTTTCGGANSMFGWQMTLPGLDEQIIYNPTVSDGILEVNTLIPSTSTIYSCSVMLPTGWTLLIDPATGGGFQTSPFLDSNGNPMTYGNSATPVSGEQLNGSGSITNITANGQNFGITDTQSGTVVTFGVNPVAQVVGHRVTWTQLR